MVRISLDLDHAPGLLAASGASLDGVGTSRAALEGVGDAVDVSAVTAALALVEEWLGAFEAGFGSFWELIQALDRDSLRLGDGNVLNLVVPSGGSVEDLTAAIEEGRGLGRDLLDALEGGDVGAVEATLAELGGAERDLVFEAALFDTLGPSGAARVLGLLGDASPAGYADDVTVSDAAWDAVTRGGEVDVHPGAAAFLVRFADVDRRLGHVDGYGAAFAGAASLGVLGQLARLGAVHPAGDDLRVAAAGRLVAHVDVDHGLARDGLVDAARDGEVAARVLGGEVDGHATADTLFSREVQADAGLSSAVGALVLAGSVDLGTPTEARRRMVERATLATVSAVARDGARVGAGSRPALARLYEAHVDDFAHAAVTAPSAASAAQLEGRRGVELGGAQARAYLAEVAASPDAYTTVLAATADRMERYTSQANLGRPGVDLEAHELVANRYAGALHGLALGGLGDGLLASGLAEDAQRATYERVVGAALEARDPRAAATQRGIALTRDVVGDALFGDGTARADAEREMQGHLRAASDAELLHQATSEYEGYAATVGLGDRADPAALAAAEQVVAEVRAFDATLPADERFLDDDGALRPEAVSGEDPRRQAQLLRVAAGEPGAVDRLRLPRSTDAVGLTPENYAFRYLEFHRPDAGNA